MSTTTKTLKQIRLGDEHNPPRVPLPKEQSLPSSLASLPVWIVWELQWKPDDGKWAKMPHQLLNGQARTKGWNAPGNQTTLASCLEWIRSKSGRETRWGVGFIGKEDGPCALDFDDVLDEAGNIKNPDVAAWVDSTRGELFWEKSVSGSGLHAFGIGLNLDGQGRNFTLVKGGSFETLVGNRYCAVTGDRFADSALELGDLSPIYKEVSREAKQGKNPENPGKTTGPATETPRKTGVSTPTSTGGKEFREVLRDDARAYAAQLPPSISGSGGHTALMKAAVNLAKGWGYGDPSKALSWESDGLEIFEEYNARAIPPESPEQVAHKWKSAKEGKATGKDFYAEKLKAYEDFQARHSPSGSPHAAPPSSPAKGDWGPIGVVEDDEAREVKKPPLHTLPAKIAQYLLNQAERMNAPVDFGALALLGSAGAMVGNAGVALLKGGRKISCVIWGAGVANPGKTKSAPMEEVTEQIKKADTRCISEFNKKMRKWNRAKEDFEKGGHGAPFTKPKPQQQTLYLNDFTSEKLASVLSVNPKGVLVYQDEITQFVRSMNQYNAGSSDRSKHLESWGCAPMKVSRKGAPNDLVVGRPHYGILGTIQPDFLTELATQRGAESSRDGFLDRFLFVYPKELPARGAVDLEKDPESERAVTSMFSNLIELDVCLRLPGTGTIVTATAWRDGDPINGFDEDDADQPGSDEFVADVREEDCLPITKDGWEAWKKVSADFAAERNSPHLDKALDGAWSKMEAYYLRIANIIQHIWWACGEAPKRNISAEAIEAAAEWADYFKDHTRKAYGVMAQRTLGKDAVVGLDWIKEQKGEAFTRSDIRTGIRSRLNRCPKRLTAVLEELEAANVIRQMEAQKFEGRGRGKPPLRYEINPRARGK